MAWSFTNLSYGWKYVVGISLAATTIYVASNTRWRVNQADDIELDLAVAERCLATQYGTNAAGEPLYYVSPPEYVRSWHSNSYVTTNVPGDAVTNWTAQLHTNVFTNVIGWRTDRAMMIDLDTKIKALVPHYVDSNTVSDGATNIVALTVTGLWASLSIGDGTNQFTRTPAGVGTNVTSTYGDYPWQIYVEDLQERYKVLNALSYMYRAATLDSLTKYGGANGGDNPDHRSDVTWMKNAAEISYTASTPYTSTTFYVYSRILRIWRSPYGSQEAWYDTTLERTAGDLTVTNIPVIPDVTHTWELYLVAEGTTNWIPTFADTCNWDFDDHGDFTYAPVEGELSKVESGSASSDSSHSASFGSFGLPTWCTTPPVSTVNYRGYIARDYGFLINWQFNYATNKYW